MRVAIDSNNQEKPIIVTVVKVFLDYHLVTNYYGEGFDSVFVDFIANPKINEKFKRRLLYGTIAEIEVPKTFTYSESVSIEEFEKVYAAFKEALVHLDEIEIKTGSFDVAAFRKDVEALKKRLPKNEKELNHWQRANDINRKINSKIFDHRNNNPDFDKRQQAKQIPLREFLMSFEPLSHFATNEEKEKERIKKRRKKEVPICWIQSEFITRHIRDEARKLKFKGQYHTVSIVLSNRYEIQKGTEGLNILIPFDYEKYREVYPPYEVDVPIKEIISHENEAQVNLFMSNLILDALGYAKKEDIYLPLDSLIEIVKNFIANDYKYEWYHKSRVFKDLGVKARLHCRLTNYKFSLDFVLLNGKIEVFRKEIHKSQPWKEAWRRYYEDIILKDNHLIVTHQYLNKSIFKISTTEVLRKLK